MNGNQFRLLIDNVIEALETASCEEWILVRLDDTLATIKSASIEMSIRLFTISRKTKVEFTGIYNFPGAYYAKIHNFGPKQTMRVDRAAPSLIAFKILTRFFPAYTEYVRNRVTRYRRMMQNDLDIAHELIVQVEIATAGKLKSSENLSNSWSPDGPIVINLEGKASDRATVKVVFDHRSQILDGEPYRFAYSLTASSPDIYNMVEEVFVGYMSSIPA